MVNKPHLREEAGPRSGFRVHVFQIGHILGMLDTGDSGLGFSQLPRASVLPHIRPLYSVGKNSLKYAQNIAPILSLLKGVRI